MTVLVSSFVVGVALVGIGCTSSAPPVQLPADHLPDIADRHAALEARNVVHPCELTQTVTITGLPSHRTLATYTYDDDGRALEDLITDSSQRYERLRYTWDGTGHLASIEDALSLPDPPTDTDNFEVLTYDTAEHLVTDITIDREAVDFNQPAASDAFTFSDFDGFGHPAQADEIQGVVPTDVSMPTAFIHTVHSYTYDAVGRRTGVQVVDDSGAVVSSTTTVYDEPSFSVVTTVTNTAGTTMTSFQYDPAYHLVAWITLQPDRPYGEVQVGVDYDGDRERSATYVLATAEAATESVRYGCSVDQPRQEDPTVPDGTVLSSGLPLEAPYPAP